MYQTVWEFSKNDEFPGTESNLWRMTENVCICERFYETLEIGGNAVMSLL